MLSVEGKTRIPRSFLSGRYLVQRLIGRGATGSVYEVFDEELGGQAIALKLLHPYLLTEPKCLERFQSQVLLTRQLSHPNIVKVYDFDRDDEGNHFITMELVAGESLKSFLSRDPGRALPLSEILSILDDTALALAHAHALGIVHRDIKPSNLLLSYSGEVKLADFGLAKALESPFRMTQTGELLGTPAYTAPEQFRGEAVDARADVYSFGILAYELATSNLPFRGNTYFEQAEAHLSSVLPKMRPDSDQALPLWFQDFVTKCCEKEPRKRYTSATEVSQLLREHFAENERGKTRDVRFSLLRKIPHKRKKRRTLLLAASLLLALVGLTTVVLKQSSSRRFAGLWLLKAERILGVELSLLKLPFSVTASTLRPDDFFRSITELDPSRANVRSYVGAGGRLDMEDSSGNTLAHLAIQNPEQDVLQTLRFAYVDFNKRNNRGETPLLRALRLRQFNAVYTLLTFGVDTNLCDDSQTCPIHVAVDLKNDYIITVLLGQGADITAPTKGGKNILHILAEHGEWHRLSFVFRHLQSKGRTWGFNSRDSHGLTPLMYALRSDLGPALMNSLLSVFTNDGVDLNARDDEGRSGVDHALRLGKWTAAMLLLSEGARADSLHAHRPTSADFALKFFLESLSLSWLEQ